MSKQRGHRIVIELTSTWLLFLLRAGAFVALLVGSFFVYQFLINEIIELDSSFFIPFAALWVFSAYIFLPRLHRFITKIYLPNYYIGRTRTPDGFYGDPVNLAFIGSQQQIVASMQKAGWVLADELTASSIFKVIKCAVLRQSYPSAPVSRLFLFSREPDFAFQQEVNGNPRARHHVRFWKTPENWYLPGGFKVEWLAAATYDRTIGFMAWTLQINHKIAENIDEERDYIVNTLQAAHTIEHLEIKKHFTDAYHTRGGGGDRIRTDGSMPFITLK